MIKIIREEEKKINNLDEKLIKVPSQLRSDVNSFITDVIGSSFIKYFQQQKDSLDQTLENYQNIFDIYNDRINQIKNKLDIKKDYSSKLFPYFLENRSFRLSNYKFKYGEVDDILKEINVILTIDDNRQYNGFYSSEYNDIVLTGNFYIEFLNKYGFNGTHFLSRDFARDFDSVLDSFISMLDSYFNLFEHEMIHAIQYEFFGDYINLLPVKDRMDMIQYTLSDLEVNPLLISQYREYKKLFPTINRDTFDAFIATNQYFSILRNNNFKLYKKMVNSFLDIIENREGIFL